VFSECPSRAVMCKSRPLTNFMELSPSWEATRVDHSEINSLTKYDVDNWNFLLKFLWAFS
jgi:hypothetical protein